MSLKRLANAVFFFCALVLFAGPSPADISVLVPEATNRVLARSGDTLSDGFSQLRGSFDNIYWVPLSFGGGHLFINHELVYPDGGMTRLTYDPDFGITSSMDWVTGTHFNCSGMISPTGTLLSCEEHPPADSLNLGYVIEVNQSAPNRWEKRPAMGRFSHESVIMDPWTGDYYLTDDSYNGVFFRYVPVNGSLINGTLYAFREDTQDWVQINDLVNAEAEALALGATTHQRPEDLAYNPLDDAIYIMITGNWNVVDTRLGYILRFDPRTQTMTRWLDGDGINLANPDNVVVDSHGNLLVHEDQYPANAAEFGPNELLLIRLDKTIEPILRGNDLWGEMAGLAFAENENHFFINWMNGLNGSELCEVFCPPGWNAGPVGIADQPVPRAEVRLIAGP
ncbi:MAG TPA: alkaline phosphatase PhoX, partial [Candidatus Udaeobacter sp.]|nr:alkaline phosphatase PhoX [Candidatus Udaeobacter sp.]